MDKILKEGIKVNSIDIKKYRDISQDEALLGLEYTEKMNLFLYLMKKLVKYIEL